jgi:hypothetical protein
LHSKYFAIFLISSFSLFAAFVSINGVGLGGALALVDLLND